MALVDICAQLCNNCFMTLDTELNKLTRSLDSKFFKVLSEPARIEILKLLLKLGETDVNGLAEKLPQDRSVISRHLHSMSDVGILKIRKEGRHIFYKIDGKNFVGKFEEILASMKKCVSLKCC